ncbi:hypothetical protein K439DRAFT_1324242, partial [Ramaria rubella]
RALHGRFLHITDIHPDAHYRSNSSVSSSCHRKEPNSETDRAGYWGTPYRECDSPVRFVNLTLDYLAENWADEIDFVICIGDETRHDEDRRLPRTLEEIYGMNRQVAATMETIFSSRGVPVVPSLGNNDIWRASFSLQGPNRITNAYADIWQSFIPFSSYQVFQRGAYYSTDLIPNELAAISLNTLYFYDSNKAVRGCEYRDTTDPGNLQLDWLDVQLGIFRDRGMQVWMTGHVPPSPGNYFPECYRRYVELSLRFQDTIIGHLYGHMNNDFFFFLDAEDLLQPPRTSSGEVTVQKKEKLHKSLRKDFADMPKKSKIDLDEWAVVNVAPSLVANPFLPSFRIFSYNVTRYNAGEEHTTEGSKGSKRKHGHRHGGKPKDCKKKKNRDKWECRSPQKKWHSDKNAPSRKNTLWSPLGYSQFYMPGLGRGNETDTPTWELEYVTYETSALHPPLDASAAEVARFVYPVPPRLLPRELVNGTGSLLLAPYGMSDLTIGSWVKLARKLVKKKKLWKRFKGFMYMEQVPD